MINNVNKCLHIESYGVAGECVQWGIVGTYIMGGDDMSSNLGGC